MTILRYNFLAITSSNLLTSCVVLLEIKMLQSSHYDDGPWTYNLWIYSSFAQAVIYVDTVTLGSKSWLGGFFCVKFIDCPSDSMGFLLSKYCQFVNKQEIKLPRKPGEECRFQFWPRTVSTLKIEFKKNEGRQNRMLGNSANTTDSLSYYFCLFCFLWRWWFRTSLTLIWFSLTLVFASRDHWWTKCCFDHNACWI